MYLRIGHRLEAGCRSESYIFFLKFNEEIKDLINLLPRGKRFNAQNEPQLNFFITSKLQHNNFSILHILFAIFVKCIYMYTKKLTTEKPY